MVISTTQPQDISNLCTRTEAYVRDSQAKTEADPSQPLVINSLAGMDPDFAPYSEIASGVLTVRIHRLLPAVCESVLESSLSVKCAYRIRIGTLVL